MLGHPAEGQQRLRSRHGRCAGRLHAAAQCRLPAGLPGRDLEATHCRDAHANPDEAEASRPHDYEYERNGVANLFMMFAPLEGWRHVEVTDRHTAIDYAHVLKDLPMTTSRTPTTIVLVQDNLNIHSQASLYEAFPAAEARRLVERFEWHYTPKHGSWLDLAESELAVLSAQCLDRRIPDKQALERGRRLGKHRNQPRKGRLALHNRDRSHQAQAPIPFDLSLNRPTSCLCSETLTRAA